MQIYFTTLQLQEVKVIMPTTTITITTTNVKRYLFILTQQVGMHYLCKIAYHPIPQSLWSIRAL